MGKIFFAVLVVLVFGCQSENSTVTTSDLFSIKNLSAKVAEIKSPVEKGGEPNLFSSESGQLYMSWVEYIDTITDALMFSQLIENQWTPPKEIARGNDWFVNWADFPSIVAFKNNDQHLAAHWLQKRAAGTYDYDIHISISKNDGDSWSESFIIHTDGIAAEHGFVTMLPTDDNKIFATWLDGRNTKTGKKNTSHDNHGHGHGDGAMTLRTATFDVDGNLSNEAELDDRICDCCQTTATINNGEPIVAYRDRSEDEIRDIFFTKKIKNTWSVPKAVHDDNWKIAGCPVNGPSIANRKNQTAIAWYTASNEKPKVNVAFSNDGNSFNEPIQIDDGNPLGRVGIVMPDFPKGNSDNLVYVVWMEKYKEEAAIKLAKVTSEGKKGKSFTITKSSASRGSGFPQLDIYKNQLVVAWTEVSETSSTVKTAFIEIQ